MQILDEPRMTATINSGIEITNCDGSGGGEFTFIALKSLGEDRSATNDSKHKAVFNLSGINASVGSSDTQLPRTKADYRASAGALLPLQPARGIFERLARKSSFTLFTRRRCGTVACD
ncbi:unnamed protein product [Colias eurytheme]|nr:unnamed protein product [Colias eurytheme]